MGDIYLSSISRRQHQPDSRYQQASSERQGWVGSSGIFGVCPQKKGQVPTLGGEWGETPFQMKSLHCQGGGMKVSGSVGKGGKGWLGHLQVGGRFICIFRCAALQEEGSKP